MNEIKNLKLSIDQSQKHEGIVTEKELLRVLTKMPNNESSGNDGTTKTFWDELKTSLLASINKAFGI